MRVLLITRNDDGMGPMAASFLRDYSAHLEVVSVGRCVCPCIHPMVVAAMHECLIDLDGYLPRHIADVDEEQFDVVVEWPEKPLPDDLESLRILRDDVKNASFVFYRDVLRKSC